MNLYRFRKQLFFRFTVVLVRDTAVYRADFLAGFFAMKADAFGAEIRLDFVEIFAFGDCSVWTFRFANATVDTFISDKCCDFFSSSSQMLFQKMDQEHTKTNNNREYWTFVTDQTLERYIYISSRLIIFLLNSFKSIEFNRG